MNERKSAVDRKNRIFIASVASDCRAAAEKWGLGVESDRFCTAAEMDEPDALAREEAFLAGVSRRIVHGHIGCRYRGSSARARLPYARASHAGRACRQGA